MKTIGDFRAIFNDVSCPPFVFSVGNGSPPYLQVQCYGTCNVTNLPMSWGGRKWRLSPHMTKSEVVQTAFMAALAATEHELRETFKYRGQPIFDPHYDVDRLVALRADATSISERA